MRPFCVNCSQQMKPTKNGRAVEINDSEGNPYQIFHGDEYTCQSCGHKIVAGFGRSAWAERHQEQYGQIRSSEQAHGNLLIEARR